MDKPISVGDLVQVVRPNECGCFDRAGFTFIATRIRRANLSGSQCLTCGTFGPERPIVVEGHLSGTIGLRRLKRIPPLGELEGEKRDEKLTEPA